MGDNQGRGCRVCGGSPFHKLSCPELGRTLWVVLMGLGGGAVAAGLLGMRMEGLAIASVTTAAVLLVNVVRNRG